MPSHKRNRLDSPDPSAESEDLLSSEDELVNDVLENEVDGFDENIDDLGEEEEIDEDEEMDTGEAADSQDLLDSEEESTPKATKWKKGPGKMV